MNRVTAEEIYNEYHKQTFYAQKGIYPKAIKNFDKQKEKDAWAYFERFANMVNDNGGQIDYKLYIHALTKFYQGRFNPKMLSHPKGIKIYRNYVNVLNSTVDDDKIVDSALRGIQFSINYCLENGIPDFDGYVFENQNLIPTLAKHFRAGSICKFYLALIPNIKLIIGGFPADVQRDYFETFLSEYTTTRALTIAQPKLRNISDNIESLFNSLVKERMKK